MKAKKGAHRSKSENLITQGKTVNPSMAKALRLASVTGAWHRTITRTRPNINDPLTLPKKGMGHHRIRNVFGKKSYHYNDKFTPVYDLLKQDADLRRQDIVFITGMFNSKMNLILRELDACESKHTMIREVRNRLRKYKFLKKAIVVLEECPKSFVTCNNTVYRRLHFHIATTLSANEITIARNTLFKGCVEQRVTIKDHWIEKRPYDSNDEWDEEEFGETIPFNTFDHDSEHWMNTCVHEVVDKKTGEIKKIVHRKLPFCLRGVDYMTKTIQKRIGRGENYTFIGLNKHKSRREALAREARQIEREYY